MSRRARFACALAATLLATGCGARTFATGIATSPDGQIVTVTGGRLRYAYFAWVEHAYEWHCVRVQGGRLACRRDEQHLPRHDE